MPSFDTFGAWLKYHREKERYSMRSLAGEIGRSHTYIQKLEEDDSLPENIKPRPPVEIISKIATLLDANLTEAKLLAGYSQIEQPGTIPMSDYGIVYSPGWENLSDENRRLMGKAIQAFADTFAAQLAASPEGEADAPDQSAHASRKDRQQK